MDNLFGKEDSENESDAMDITDKSEKFENEFHDSIKIEEHEIKEELNTSGASGVDPGSDLEQPDMNDINVSMSSEKSMETSVNKTIPEMDINHDDDLFPSNIVLPRVAPIPVKERRESKEKNKRELEEEEREKMQLMDFRVLVSNFTEDQLDRYEMYRRAAFPKAAIKRIMQTITGCSVSQNVVIAMSGIAKVFVGEIVEEALDVAEAHGESSGPLQPKHLRESVRTLRLQGQIPTGRTRKAFLRL